MYFIRHVAVDTLLGVAEVTSPKVGVFENACVAGDTKGALEKIAVVLTTLRCETTSETLSSSQKEW